MTREVVPAHIRHFIRERAQHHCEYCQTSEWLSGFTAEIDHIQPRAIGGSHTVDNLCLACRTCNGSKSAKQEAHDPITQMIVPLFNPRQQQWANHFQWDDMGTHIIGLTPSGRATIEALHMNNELIVAARTLWVAMGNHPPYF